MCGSITCGQVLQNALKTGFADAAQVVAASQVTIESLAPSSRRAGTIAAMGVIGTPSSSLSSSMTGGSFAAAFVAAAAAGGVTITAPTVVEISTAEGSSSMPAWGYFLIALGCLIAIMIPILVLLATSSKRGRSLSEGDGDVEKNTGFLAYQMSQMEQQPGVHDQENPPSRSTNKPIGHEDVDLNMQP